MKRVQLVASLVAQIRAFLAQYDVRSWPEVLKEWEAMLSRVRTDSEAIVVFRHIREGLWGMGRLADVVIAPDGGHVTTDQRQLDSINEQFLLMVKALSDSVAVDTPAP